MLRILALIAAACPLLFAQSPVDRSWSILESGVADAKDPRRLSAVRALGLITKNTKRTPTNRVMVKHSFAELTTLGLSRLSRGDNE